MKRIFAKLFAPLHYREGLGVGLLLFGLLIGQGVWAQTEGTLTGSGTDEDPYLIGSVEDWCTLANNIAAGNRYKHKKFKMTADIDLGDRQEMLGTEPYPFAGDFDGQGHTLTIHYVSDKDYCAPFSRITPNENSIKCLHVDGTILTSGKYAGGIIGDDRYYDAYIHFYTYLWSSVEITSTVEGEGFHGGIAGCVESQPYFRNCLFDGSLKGPNTSKCGGILGYYDYDSYCHFQSCLYDPKEQTVLDDGSATFGILGHAKGKIVTIAKNSIAEQYYPGDSFYKHALGDTQDGIDASAMDIDELWSRLGGEWQLVDGKLVPQMPVTQPLAGSGTQEDPYLISSADDWKVLKYNLMAGCDYKDKYFLQTQSFTTSEMVGTMHYAFAGRYDGGGNTITFNIGSEENPVKQEYTAPFRYVKKDDRTNEVSFKNLHTDGHIYTAVKFAGGLMAHSMGEIYITNCRSSMNIHSYVDGDGTHGGFGAIVISYRNTQTAHFTGCVFDGSLLGDKTINCGGFVGWAGTNVDSGIRSILEDCLFCPKEITFPKSDNTESFVRPSTSWVTISRCYYTYLFGTPGFYDGKSVHRVLSGSEGFSFSEGTPRRYETAGIQSYNNSICLDGTYYAVQGATITITPDLPGYRYTCEGGGASINGNRLRMGNADVTVNIAPIDWAEGRQGTEAEPYLIQNTEQMNLLSQRVNEERYEGKYFELGADLKYDGTENNFTPVGSSMSKYFGGVFDGKGHSISGININRDAARQALFGVVSGGAVKNLTLTNSTISGSGDGHGGIVGYLQGGGTVENCHVASTVTVSGKNYVGGLVGSNLYGTISGCTSGASVSGNNSIGGIVGGNGNSSPSTDIDCVMENCVYYGTSVTGTNRGAIAGNENTHAYTHFTYSHNYYTATGIKGVKGDDITKDDGAVPALRDNADNSTAIGLLAAIPEGLGTYSVTLSGRTLYKDGSWNIICLPFSLTAEQVSSLLESPTGLKMLQSSSFANGVLTLNFEDATSIEAGKPYLVKWETGDAIADPTFTNVTINNTSETTTSTDYVDFVGKFSPVSLKANDKTTLYLGDGNKLNFPSADMTVGACRAVFHLKGLTADDLRQGARSIVLNLGDEVTVVWDDMISVTVTEPNTLAQALGLEADVSWSEKLGNDMLRDVRGDYSHVYMLKVTGPIGFIDMALLKYLAGYCPWTDSRNYAGHLEYLDLYDADIKEASVENELPKHAFQRAYNLKTLILPKTCRKVNERALQECESLETLVIGDDMEDFNWNALDDDAMLTRMYILAKKKVDISSELPIWRRLCNDHNPTFDAFYVRPSLYQDYVADANYTGSSWQGTNNVTTGFFNDDASFCAFASHGTATQDELAAVTTVKGWFDGHQDVLDLWPLRYTKVSSLDKATIAPLKELEQIALPESLNDMEDGLFENAKHLRYADFLLCNSTDMVAGLRNGGFQKLGINTYQTLAYVPATYGETDETNVVVANNNAQFTMHNAQLFCKTYRVVDSLSYFVPYEFEAEQIESARIMQKDAVPYTICLPYKLEVPTGARAYGLSQRTGSKLVFEEVKGELEAMKPYLLKVVGNKRQRLNSANLNTKISQTIPANSGTTYGRQVDVLGYTLRGTFDALSNSEAAELGAYVLQADGNWHPVMTDTEAHQRAVIPPFRAYLLPNARNAAARIGMELIDDDATDIDTIETIDADGTRRYYDLQGRELPGEPAKGIYIYKGRKVKAHP